jgi:hypothetical protein
MMAVMSVTADILVIVPAVLGSTLIGAIISAASRQGRGGLNSRPSASGRVTC